MQMTPEEAIKSLASFASKPIEELKDKICALCCQVTDSTLSYFATMDATEKVLTMVGWSKSAMIHCSMIDKPIIYKIENTGLWGDAVRERKPVITNDYASLVKPTKKGYPDGHVRLRRHMNLPILEGQHIAMVVGVGNKGNEYTLDDAKALKTFMDAAWKTLKPKL
ncbi:hypothetical protein SBA2_10010 [Acidobacteriia bacterium SbA2]|nr:hypothetical protein SBA2_10010 [Acidobacteriia bacterium SbA2]